MPSRSDADHAVRMAVHHERRLASLDGIRGIAILCVLAFHLAAEVAPGGAIGVGLFFALSGFLITGLLWDEVTATGGIALPYFWFRRAARLLPALLVMVLVIGPIASLIVGERGIVSNGLTSLFYVADFAAAGLWFSPIGELYRHAWSLAVEEQFYLVWPLVLVGLSRLRISTTVLALAAFPLGLGALVASRPLGSELYWLPPGHLWALMAGASAAFAMRSPHSSLRRWASSSGVAVAALATLVGLLLGERDGTPYALWLLEVTASGIAFGALLLHASTGSTPVTRMLELPALRWAGTRSYGIYLYHGALLHVFAQPYDHLHRATNGVLFLVVVAILAELSFRLLERPARTTALRLWGERARRVESR